MNNTLSLVYPSQPQVDRYGLANLHAVVLFNRQSYKEFFGAQAPPFDSDKPVKRWVVNDGTSTFHRFDWDLQQIVMDTMPASEAATINLPGAYEYPQWNNPITTPAVAKGPSGLIQLSGVSLAREDAARELAAQIRADLADKNVSVGVNVADTVIGPWEVVWNGETRRRITITVNGLGHDAASLLALRNFKGVGAPGRWEVIAVGGITSGVVRFVHDTPVTEPLLHEEVWVPLRPLFENERVVMHAIGTPMVEKIKVEAPPVPVPNDGVSEAVLAELRELRVDIAAISTFLGLPPRSQQ